MGLNLIINMALSKNIILICIFISIFSSFASGATVYGNIYDLSLSKVLGARVEVNTTPQQYLVSKEGIYSFDIPNGFYTIKAELRTDGVTASETRNLSITKEGKYVIDLILFPNFDEEDDISQDIGIVIPETEGKSFVFWLALIFIFIIGVIFYILFKRKKTKESGEKYNEENKEIVEDDEEYLDKIVNIVEDEGGRTTQKHIRKQIPLSEGKISLMIAELEHKGVIEKIKKGRGNIIILKKTGSPRK